MESFAGNTNLVQDLKDYSFTALRMVQIQVNGTWMSARLGRVIFF